MDNTGPRVKSHFHLPSLLILCSCQIKITHAMYYNCGGLHRQKTQKIKSLFHCTYRQFSFVKTRIVSLNS